MMNQIKKFLQPALLALTLLFSIDNSTAQTITPRFFSQNAWMPDTVGNASNCAQAPCILYGSLHNKWSKIGASGAKMVRFGGIAADRNMPTNYQYIKMIDSIRAKGMEPIIQVPFHNWRYSATQAAAIVQYINVTKGKNIKYWIIGNEPDHEYGYTTANQVASYIKPFASAMKAVDPSILIVGPETAWYNTNIINGLTTPGGADDITGVDANGRYYVDIISFHQYAYDGTQSRTSMLSSLTSSGNYEDRIIALNGRIANCNTYHNRTGNAALKSAITEANLDWQNPTTDNLNGTGVNSFIGGQFIAEMFGLGLKNNVDFINMWSVVEGNNTALNIGYIDSQTGNKKPAYYHFQLMAENFAGSYLTSASTQTNVKVFSCQNSGTTTVMVMNEDISNNYNCTVRLNMSAASGTNALKINVNANIAQEYNTVIQNQSTVLLFFNAQGVLIKQIDYSLANHATSNLAPTVTTFTSSVQTVAQPVNSTPVANLSACNGNSTTLTASSGTNAVSWYASATSTLVLGTGSVFTTPALTTGTSSTSISYYAAASAGTVTSVRAPVTITVNPAPTISVNSGVICSGSTFTMVPAGASTYTFSNGSATVSPVVSTSYSVTGRSAAGCLSANTAVATVSVGGALSISVNSGAICAGGVFTMTPSGANSYTFSSGSSTVSPTANSSYTVWGSNSSGCTGSAVATVSVNARPSIAVNNGTICGGGSFVMVPTGAASYSFSSGSATVTPSSSTSYSVTGISAQGCTSSNTAVVSVNVSSAPVISVNSGAICPGEVFTMIPSGASSYTFSNGSATVSPSSSASYSVSGTNAAGCISTAAAVANVTVNSRPVVTVNSGSICEGAAFVMIPSGAATYTFSNGSATVTPTSNSNYTVTGTSAEGCTSAAPAIANVVVNARPVISVNSGSICAGSQFTITPSGASTYTVLNSGFVVSPVVNTAYQVVGRNGNGCESAIAVSNVSVQAIPVISANSGTICKGNSFTLAPMGAANYTFSSGSPVVSPVNSTSYTITGSTNGCVGHAVSNVTVIKSSKGCLTGTMNVYVTPTAITPTVAAPTNSVSLSTEQGSVSAQPADSSSTATGIDVTSASLPMLSVYPNPNNGEFNIETDQDGVFTLFNISGGIVRTSAIAAGKTQVNISDLPTGIYIVKITRGEKAQTSRILKQ